MQTAEMKLPQLITALPGPKAKQIVERDHEVVSPSYTRDYPLVAKTGRGAMVEDVDGNTFLDFAAGIAVVATGHCHPRSRRRHSEAGGRADSHVVHGFLLSGHGGTGGKTGVDRAGRRREARLFRQFRHGSDRSGDEARALSHGTRQIHRVPRLLSRAHDGRAFAHGEQGRAAQGFRRAARGRLSRAVSEYLSRRNGGPPRKRRRRRPRVHRGGAVQAPRRSARKWPRFSSSRFKAKAAIFPRPPNFCRGSNASAASTASCWSWTKCNPAWAAPGSGGPSDHAGVEPDMICTAKGIASGMPLSAVIAKADVMDWKPGAHASTFGGNPVSIAASLATIDLLEAALHRECRAHGRIHLRSASADWR